MSFLSNKRQWTIAGLVILLIVLVGLFPPQNPAVAQSTVTLDTSSGPPGTEVTATGSGWSAGHEVKVQWGGADLAVTAVDDNGDFTVSFTVPDDAAEGQHTVYFYDVPPDGGLGYFIPANFTVTAPAETPPPEAEPTITLDPTEGPRGTEVTVQGSGWVAGDTIIIHFAISGNEVAQATVGDDGSFVTMFTVPDDAESGDQLVIAGNNEASWQTDAIFHVTESTEEPTCPEPTVTLSASSGKPGDTITVQGKDWLPGGTVAIALVDQGAQFDVGSVQVPDSGAWETSFTVPDEPYEYWLAFSENYEGCELYVEELFTIAEPTITVERALTAVPDNPEWTSGHEETTFRPGDTIWYTVVVQNSGQPVSVDFTWLAKHDDPEIDQVIYSDKTTFTAHAGAGSYYSPGTIPSDATLGTYLNRVTVTVGGEEFVRESRFEVVGEEPSCPTPTVTISASSGRLGEEFTVQGEGWLPGGVVVFSLTGPKTNPSEFTVGSATIPDSGGWKYDSFSIYGQTGLQPGDYELSFIEWDAPVEYEECELRVTKPFTIIKPSITLDPIEGAPGTEVTVRSSGWLPNATVKIHFAEPGNEVAQVKAGHINLVGSFETTFTVPADAVIGEQKVIAISADGAWQTDAIFHVTEQKEKPPSQSSVRLDLTEGPAGTKVIGTGRNWRAGEHIRVTWEDGRQLAEDATVNERGEFRIEFKVPTDAPPGTHTIHFTALESRYFQTALFTVSDEKPIPGKPFACPVYFVGVHGMNQGPDGSNLPWSPEIGTTLATFEKLAPKDTTVDGIFLEYPSPLYKWQESGKLSWSKDRGVENLESMIRSLLDKCADPKIVLAGYSMGAWVIDEWLHYHREYWPHIRGVVLYGDPQWYRRDGDFVYSGLARQHGWISGSIAVGPYPPDENYPEWESHCLIGDAVCGEGYGLLADKTPQLIAANTCQQPNVPCTHKKYVDKGWTKRGGEFLASKAFQ